MEFTFSFIELFIWSIYLVSPLLLFLAVIIVLLGLVVSKIEQWNKFDALYWALITATTVGYGDIRPIKKASRVLSILIAIIGMMLSGIIIAVTLNSTGVAFEKHVDPIQIERIKDKLK